MSSRDINAHMSKLEGKLKSVLEELHCGQPGVRQSKMEEYLSLREHIANERPRSVEPRQLVAISRAKEKADGARLVGQRWDKAFGDNAAMVHKLSLGSSSGSLGLDEYQAADMKRVLDAFCRVHKVAGATAEKGGVALLDLCQRVIMVVLNEIMLGKERGLPRNLPWVITQLRSAIDKVATFVESLLHERPTVLRRFLYKLGAVGTNPSRGLFEQNDVTLRGILAVVKSEDALPKLSTALPGTDITPLSTALPVTDITPFISEEPKDASVLPLPWDAHDVAQSLHDFAEQLGGSQEISQNFRAGEALCRRAVQIWERFLWRSHPQLAQGYETLASLIKHQGKHAEADSLYTQATEIWKQSLGPDHPTVASSLNSRALLLESQGKYDEADPLYQRALAIDEKVLGPDHPDVAKDLNNRAELLRAQGKYDDAEPLYERSQAIREKVLGPEHPDVAQSLNNRAWLLKAQGKFSEAEPLYKRTQEIFEKSLGADHPNVATILNNRAALLYLQENNVEAVPLVERALAIRTKKLGENHPDTISARSNLEAVRKKVWRRVEATTCDSGGSPQTHEQDGAALEKSRQV